MRMSSGYSAKAFAVPVWQSARSAAVVAAAWQSAAPMGVPVRIDVGVPLIPEKSGIRLW
ncbi:hypothetical protein D3C83_265000 [compost metagenome]